MAHLANPAQQKTAHLRSRTTVKAESQVADSATTVDAMNLNFEAARRGPSLHGFETACDRAVVRFSLGPDARV